MSVVVLVAGGADTSKGPTPTNKIKKNRCRRPRWMTQTAVQKVRDRVTVQLCVVHDMYRVVLRVTT